MIFFCSLLILETTLKFYFSILSFSSLCSILIKFVLLMAASLTKILEEFQEENNEWYYELLYCVHTL